MSRTKPATTRLLRDLRELERDDTIRTASARPVEDDIFTWHINLRPDDGPLSGAVFHLIATFPDDYPCSPPTIELMNELVHPNVFGSHICLDMLKREHATTPYAGWTSAYSVASILLQLQSFLFAENVPQDDGGVQANEYYGGRAPQRGSTRARRARRLRAGDARTAPGRRGRSRRDARPRRRGGRRRAAATTCVTKRLPAAMLVEARFLDAPPLTRVGDACRAWRAVREEYALSRGASSCASTRSARPRRTRSGRRERRVPPRRRRRDARACPDPFVGGVRRDYVRLGVWKERFELFLPLVIDARHAARAEPLFRRAVARVRARWPRLGVPALPRGLEGAEPPFEPRDALRLLCCLMNSMAVLMQASTAPAAPRTRAAARSRGSRSATGRDRRVGARSDRRSRATARLTTRCSTTRCGAPRRSATSATAWSTRRGRRARAPQGRHAEPRRVALCLTLAQGGRTRVRVRPRVVRAQRALVRERAPELRARRPRRPRAAPAGAAGAAAGAAPVAAEEGGCAACSSARRRRGLMFQVHFLLAVGRPAGARGPEDVLAARSEARSAERRAARARARGLPRDRAVRRLAGVLPRGARRRAVSRPAHRVAARRGTREREERLPRQRWRARERGLVEAWGSRRRGRGRPAELGARRASRGRLRQIARAALKIFETGLRNRGVLGVWVMADGSNECAWFYKKIYLRSPTRAAAR